MDDDYLINQSNRRKELKMIDQLISTGGYCVLCGYHLDPRNIELHHIAGRKHGDVTVPVCHNCHQTLSRAQSDWPEEWLSSNQSPEVEMALMLRGQSDIHQLISKQLRQMSDDLIDKMRREGT